MLAQIAWGQFYSAVRRDQTPRCADVYRARESCDFLQGPLCGQGQSTSYSLWMPGAGHVPVDRCQRQVSNDAST